MTTIIGIDPGSRVTGYGVITQADRQVSFIASGVIRLESSNQGERLNVLFESLSDLLKEYQPNESAIEKVFVGKSADSALKLGQARGVALLALQRAGLSVAEYAPRKIKQTVTGSGGADKTQINDMVVRSLRLNGRPSADAADALAIALCHAYSANFQRVLGRRERTVSV